jgi:DNA invertase Pin-like site-specific DNA recombinase
LGQIIAIYCRVSTTDQSCERQEQDLKEFAKRSGYEVGGVFKEKASGVKNDREARNEILKLAQARKIQAILVTELSRWGRSTMDLVDTLQTLQAWNVSLIALNGLQFDLTTAHGKMIASVMASLAEFERDLLQERIKSGIKAAQAKGKRIGRQKGEFIKSDKLMPKVLAMIEEKKSYRTIAADLKISKNTVTSIVKRHRQNLIDNPVQKAICVEVEFYVENNNKHVRGKKKAKEDIEMFVLRYYDMKKLKNGSYRLMVPYDTEQEIDINMHDIIAEMHQQADSRNCFLDYCYIREVDGERSWD